MILLPGPRREVTPFPKQLALLRVLLGLLCPVPDFRMWLEPCRPKSLEVLLELKEVTPVPEQSPLVGVLMVLLPGPLKLVEFSLEG